jgi:hypothetical protein
VDPHHPTGRPGTRAPHVVLEQHGHELSTLDLFGSGFVLLASSTPWRNAAHAAARALGVPLTVRLIGPAGELRDVDGDWSRDYGVGAGGAVLVRPDGYIAWRTTTIPADPERVLYDAVAELLCRSERTAVAAP